jgi:hypothetical protein
MYGLVLLLFVGSIVLLGIAEIGSGITAMGISSEKGHSWFAILLCVMPVIGITMIYIGVDHIISIRFDRVSAILLSVGPLLVLVVPLAISLIYLTRYGQSIGWVWKYLISGLICLFLLFAILYGLFAEGVVKRGTRVRSPTPTAWGTDVSPGQRA